MKIKKLVSMLLVWSLICSLLTVSGGLDVNAKSKKTNLSKSSVVLTVGMKKTIKLKNPPKVKAKKVVWESSNKKVVTIKRKAKYEATIYAKGKGKAIVKAKVKGKTYKCKVRVVPKKSSTTQTEVASTTNTSSTEVPKSNKTADGNKTTEKQDSTEVTTESNIETSHSWGEGVITKAPTCTDKGIKTYTCANCGDTKTEEVAAKGHSYVKTTKEGDCTHRSQIINTCSVCGDTKTEEGDYTHIKINGGTKDSHSICANCGFVIEDGSKHVYKDSDSTATCTKNGTVKRTCSCGYSYTENIDALGHDYNEKGICKRCFKVNSSINNVIRAYDVSENQDKSILMYTKDEDNNGLYESYIETLVPGSRLHKSVKESTDATKVVNFLNTGIFSSHIEKVIFVNKTLAPIDSSYLFSYIGSGYNNIDANDKIGIYNLLNLDTTDVTNMAYMFASFYSGAKEKPTTLNVSNFDTSNVTNMHGMFDYCYFLTSLDISNFDTSNVTDMSAMFYGCESLTTLDVSNFDTRNLNNIQYMFACCKSLTALNLYNFDTRNVTDMNSMFNGCEKLTTLDLSSFNTSKVTNMRHMFGCCDSLTNVDLSTFNTHNVEDMSHMFNGCGSLTELNLKSFNTKKVTSMYNMFSYCSKLKKVDVLVDNWEVSNNCDTDEMFAGCETNAVTYNYH